MVQANYRTVVFQAAGPYHQYFPTVRGNFQYIPPRQNIIRKINELFLRALAYVQAILKVLQSSTPFFQQYQPIINELPKMYKLMKVMNELKDEEESAVEGRNAAEEESTLEPKVASGVKISENRNKTRREVATNRKEQSLPQPKLYI